jgi:hypothetical protein
LVTPVLGVATATSINSTTIPTSKTLVVTTDKLNALAATSSSELAGVISDETGTGSVVLSNSPTFTGTVTAPIYASTPQALTDAATISWNPTSGLNASVTLGGNRTLSFASTPAVGSYGTLIVTQDATGNRTITLPSALTNKVLGSSSTTTIALSTAANAKDILNFYYDGTNCYWNVGQGYGTAAPAVITNLATNVSGTLAVANGGTGATTLSGLVKGNGTGAMTAAVAGTDYVAPSGSITGNAATVTTNANLTGVVTSSGNTTAIAAGVITNTMLANTAVANLSGTNTGDNAVNSLYSGLVSNATHTGDVTGATTLTLATVNSSVGSFGTSTSVPTFTVNAKGLVTAASATSIPTATSTTAGLLTSTDWTTFNNKQPAATNLTSIGALTNASGVLVNNGSGVFSYTTSPTLTGTNFTSVPYTALSGTVPTWNQNTTGSAGSVANALTFAASGGAAAGATFNGSSAKTIDYSSIGAAPTAGSTSITTLGTISSGTWNGTTIATAYGGTGLTSFTSNGAVYATSTSALTTGTLPIASGGTGSTTKNFIDISTDQTSIGGNKTFSNTITANTIVKTGGTSAQFLMADGSVSSGTPLLTEADVEVTATAAGQTSFALTQIPSSLSKVKMYVNGIRISKTAYTISGSTLTYIPANNESYSISVGDRVQFEFAY